MTRGVCLCGAVEYQFTAPFTMMMHCHCSMCRKHHGAAFATFAAAPYSAFRWVRGENAIEKYKSSISIQGWIGAAVNDLLIPTDDYTVAIAHVHGRGADVRPADIDVRSRVPNFVISQNALYVTVPGTSRVERIRGGVDESDGWNRPCSTGLAIATR